MPRGAIPAPRFELAASEPYRPDSEGEALVPSGHFPTPNNELAAAQPYRPTVSAPESFLAWPIRIGLWGSEAGLNSSWAEEAFAKACAEPRVFISDDVLLTSVQECGSSNFAAFLQTRGFEMDGKAYLTGPFHSLDWTNPATLNGAIANAGPVKIGIASVKIASGPLGKVTPWTSGWAIHGLPPSQPEDFCASLCGYGPLAALVDLFERNEVNVNLPSGMPTGLCYAMFTRGSIGIVDRQSLLNITGEAWVRIPTTVVKNFSA